MDSKSLIPCLILSVMICHVSSDFAQDKKQCKDQLISLSSCITYVSGDAKAPSPTCCSELTKDVSKTKLCLCILVKDRNEPGLGFKLNATLALSLIPVCHIHTNATICQELLHLAPNSPEAQIFKQLNNISGVGNSSSSGEITPSSSTTLSIKGFRPAAIYGPLIWLLVSV
ncbi:hypothetical protein CDL12_20258 [Handroanthus impetiginosus]|uniref:Bifunctional inhibitor/plant lipid transfer protein/seed storage helical domain-containing protein n=1 Tax=Handroanthus impetiginosus TaxID=429701 RepID=A0A2G9GPD6_9LAMI|nr:hypothetical protein CDL12_20258 [Handroanthus impetiginosus]